MAEEKKLLHIPIVGYMEKQPDGSYKLNEEKSEWADVDPDFMARFLIEKFGYEKIFGEPAHEGW